MWQCRVAPRQGGGHLQPIGVAVSEEPCERSGLLPSGCAHCRGHTDRPRPVVRITFRARYDGRCGYDRSHLILEGDLIADSNHGYLCTACIDEAL